jgi:pantoate kinase
MSAAGTLSACLAVASLFRVPKQRTVETAHLAELLGGGGLGGVSAILGGGLETRSRAGIPPWGQVDHAHFPHALLVGVAGRALLSPPLLRDPRFLDRVERAAGDLDRLGRHPGAAAFLAASESFTDRMDLAPPVLRRVVRGLRRRGCRAAQAMFGQSFFAVAPTASARRSGVEFLETAGVWAVEISPARTGAHLLGRLSSAGQAF